MAAAVLRGAKGAQWREREMQWEQRRGSRITKWVSRDGSTTEQMEVSLPKPPEKPKRRRKAIRIQSASSGAGHAAKKAAGKDQAQSSAAKTRTTDRQAEQSRQP